VADLRTKNPAHHEPAILQGARRVRYLKLIALFKIGKGALLLVAGASLLFLNTRARWMDALSNWTADEILLEHSRTVVWLLHKLQAVLRGRCGAGDGFPGVILCCSPFSPKGSVFTMQPALGGVAHDLCDRESNSN
jgi:hypothetical protein